MTLERLFKVSSVMEGLCDFNSWGVGGADRPPGFYLPSLCSERRCRREPFQHHGAVHQPLSVLKVDRTVLTFAAWATSLVVWWNITVFRFALAIKPHSVDVLLIKNMIWALWKARVGPKATLGDQIWSYTTSVLGHLGNKAFQPLWWGKSGKYLHHGDNPNWVTVVQSLPNTAAW